MSVDCHVCSGFGCEVCLGTGQVEIPQHVYDDAVYELKAALE